MALQLLPPEVLTHIIAHLAPETEPAIETVRVARLRPATDTSNNRTALQDKASDLHVENLSLVVERYYPDKAKKPTMEELERAMDEYFEYRSTGSAGYSEGYSEEDLLRMISDSREEPKQSKYRPQPLLAICQTCKLLHSLAIPFLYRTITSHGSLSLLARTLFEKPEYGAYIRKIHVDFIGVDYLDIPPDIAPDPITAYNEAFQRYNIVDDDAGHVTSITQDDVTRYGKNSLGCKESINAKVTMLILCHAPNIQHLEIRICRCQDGHFLRPVNITSLSKLKTVGFISNPYGKCAQDPLYGRHPIPTYHRWILDAAPNLQTLLGLNVCGVSHLSHSTLTTLILQRTCLTAAEARETFARFPKLKSFIYDSFPETDAELLATPSNIARALKTQYSKSLEYVDINYRGYEDHVSESLNEHLALKELPAKALMIDLDAYRRLSNESENMFFERLLPRMAKTLIITGKMSLCRPEALARNITIHCSKMKHVWLPVWKMEDVNYANYRNLQSISPGVCWRLYELPYEMGLALRSSFGNYIVRNY